jgi:hypothetical protein
MIADVSESANSTHWTQSKALLKPHVLGPGCKRFHGARPRRRGRLNAGSGKPTSHHAPAGPAWFVLRSAYRPTTFQEAAQWRAVYKNPGMRMILPLAPAGVAVGRGLPRSLTTRRNPAGRSTPPTRQIDHQGPAKATGIFSAFLADEADVQRCCNWRSTIRQEVDDALT